MKTTPRLNFAWMIVVVAVVAVVFIDELVARVRELLKPSQRDEQSFMLDVPESISQMVDRTNRAELIADVIASDEAMASFGRAEAAT